MFSPCRGIPGRLRLRDGKVVHLTITKQQMRDFGARCPRAPAPPPAFPDWGLEPAASSWIRLRLLPPPEPHHDHGHDPPPHHHLYPREERDEPNKPRNTAVNNGESSETMATIMIWNVHPDADCAELRSLFEGVTGIVAVYYSSFRHAMLVDFVTRKAARKARNNKFYGCWVRDCPLNVAFFSGGKYVLDRDSPLPWARPGTSVCIEGFDSSLPVEEIRTMLARHFGGSKDEGGISVPTDLDGSSIGKAYMRCGSWCCFSEALNLNGSEIEGHKLSVTECSGGSGLWDGHITPDGLVTGKRKLFSEDNDGD